MATIHCNACGRLYNYRNSETCPRCGAYNRPPRRIVVDSDGTLHAAAAPAARPAHDLTALRGTSSGSKVCYERKECHENKECHEEAARRVRTGRGDGYKPQSRAAAQPVTDRQAQGEARQSSSHTGQSDFERQMHDLGAKFAAMNRPRKNKTTGTGTLMAIVVAVLVAVVPNIIDSCQSNHVSVPEPDYWEEAPVEEWNDYDDELGKDVLDGMGIDAVYQVGEPLTWQGTTIAVTGSTLSDGQMRATLPNFPGGTASCELLVLDEGSSAEGYSFHWCQCEHYDVNSQELVFTDVGEEPQAVWLLLANADNSGKTVAVELYTAAAALPADSVLRDMGISRVASIDERFSVDGLMQSVSGWDWLDDGVCVYIDGGISRSGENCQLLVLDGGSSETGFDFRYCDCDRYYANSNTLEFSGLGDTPLEMWVLFHNADSSGETVAVQLW